MRVHDPCGRRAHRRPCADAPGRLVVCAGIRPICGKVWRGCLSSKA